MRTHWMAAVAIALWAAGACAAEKHVPTTQKQKVSYAMAVAVARSIQRQRVEIDMDLFTRGVGDVLAGRTLLLSDDEMRESMGEVVVDLKRKQAEAAATRTAAGHAFLAENAKKEGVVTRPSGLQYRILDAGAGNLPTDGDAVECDYRGTLVDGTEFDSSRRRGGPATFKVGRVIPGLREALKLMPVGSRWQVFIPAELAYGRRGGGRKSKVGPNETLVFEVELRAIKPSRTPVGTPERTAAAGPAAETGKD